MFAGASLALQLLVQLKGLEDNFSSFPWQASSDRGAQCPFTGDSPGLRCPRCKTAVAEAAFHKEDKLTKFIVGEDALSWDQALQACQEDDSIKGRIAMDEALDFRGNYHFGTVGSACCACTTWKRR
ncbi:hypothetical protein WJX73_000536 [Symbiochloris irregularis]|uniref:Uncharacterized protein n=1 Tax=Symbiochloris irregularis TaxID=706552 RepID=A0AAW1NZE5_9CHLO